MGGGGLKKSMQGKNVLKIMHTARMWQKKSQHEEKNMHIIKRTVKIHA
jgi:hypothetical protein